MAESAVSFLIEYLGPLLVGEAKLLKGVRGEARKIKDELETMQAFLRDADAQEDSNHSIKIWLRQVRRAAQDTEDILDEFILHLGQYQPDGRGVFGVLRRMAHSIKQLKARHRIGRQMQDMRSRLSEISKRKDEYDLNRTEQVPIQTSTNDGVHDPRMDALFTEESALVGIDEPRAWLVGRLLRPEQRLSIISVVGMGGLGKTTLVKKVYDSLQVRNHFETYAWISVSATFKKMDLLQKMITQIYQKNQEQAPSAVDAMTDIELIQVVRDYLQSKRFVLVFDDVWEIDAWKLLRLVLPLGEYGSRVILTMRRLDLASSCCIGPSDDIHELQRLNQSMAWTLFCRRAFTRDEQNYCPPELMELAQSFVRKCCGLPLAIVTLGGLLASRNQTYFAWREIQSSLGSELESDSLRSMKDILWLSFKDLPYYLKSCYLYLSVFPENYNFGSRLVISLWMAEGFIIRQEGMTPEEVGEGYLRALIFRSLVQVTEAERYGNMSTFRILDLLREIIISKSKEENLFVSSPEENIVFPHRIRRLSIHNKGAIIPVCKSSSHLRSLFIFGMNEISIASSVPSFRGLYLLRVVHIENVPMESFPEHLTSLLHLRCLELKNNNIRHLPSSIGKLINLEALILENTCVCELPTEIQKLQRLRDLSVFNNLEMTAFPKTHGVKVPSGVVVRLRSLQKLMLVQADRGVLMGLWELTQLRTLGIVKLRREDGDDLFASVGIMRHLQSLEVTSVEEEEKIDLPFAFYPPRTLQELSLCGQLPRVPRWIFGLRNVLVLRLCWSRLNDDALNALGSLPNLQQLALVSAYDGDELYINEGAYPRLRDLSLFGLRRLKNIWVERGALPNLEILSIENCKALVENPGWLKHLTNLKKLFLQDVSMDFMNRLQRGVETGDSIQHVPLGIAHSLAIMKLRREAKQQF